MTNKKTLLGATLGLLIAIPGAALALQAPDAGPGGPRGPMIPRTRAELVTQLQQRFAQADANHDGAITQAEADAARTAMRAERRQAMFSRLDTDHDGKLSLAEFSTRPERPGGRDAPGAENGDRGPGHDRMGGRHRGPHGRGGPDGGPGGMFARADADHDGRVTFAEFSARPLAMFDRADTNHDGTLTPEEMRAARQATRDHGAPPPPPAQ